MSCFLFFVPTRTIGIKKTKVFKRVGVPNSRINRLDFFFYFNKNQTFFQNSTVTLRRLASGAESDRSANRFGDLTRGVVDDVAPVSSGWFAGTALYGLFKRLL